MGRLPLLLLAVSGLGAALESAWYSDTPADELRPSDISTDELEDMGCLPRWSFTNISFDNARLVLSNLGGQGGRCIDSSWIEDDGTPMSTTWDEVGWT